VVQQPVAADRLGDPDRHGDDHGDQEGDADQEKSLRQVKRQQRVDADVELVGVAQVPVQQLADVIQVLHRQRVVQPVRPVERRDVDRGGLGPEHGPRRTAGQVMNEQEHDDRDADDHDQRVQEAVQQVARHGADPLRRRMNSARTLPVTLATLLL
jgi:hypothetical protein